jgi:hypothetical protein
MASLKPAPSVMELITKEPLTAVPRKYIRLDQQPIALSHGAGPLPTVPTIDMKNLVLGEEATDLELEKLHVSCKDWGIFQVVCTGRN